MVYFKMEIGEPQEVKITRATEETRVNKNVTTEEAEKIAQAAVDAQQFKTINGEDIRGEGNIEIKGGGGGGDVTSVNGQKGDVVLNIPTKTSQLQNDSKFISNANSIGGVGKIWSGSQAEYDAIENKDSGILYIII